MAKKEFSYRGKSVQELQEMSAGEFAKLVTARPRKSLLKGYDKKILKKIENARKTIAMGKEPRPIRTHKRDLVIIPQMIGLKMAIHRGNSFETVEIIPEMLGLFLGELALTRKRLTHGKAGIGATRSSTALASARG